MTGGDIIVALLNAHAPFAALIPADRVKLGALPEGVTLPAIVVRTISSIDRQPLTLGQRDHVTERQAVTVRAKTYAEQRAIIAAIRAACAGKTGNMSGTNPGPWAAFNVSVRTAGTGPDVRGPANSYEQAQDFRVSFETDR